MNYKIETIEGIGKVMGDKLRASGIADTAALLAKTNAEKKLVRQTPSLSAVKGWIAAAKDMPRVLEY